MRGRGVGHGHSGMRARVRGGAFQTRSYVTDVNIIIHVTSVDPCFARGLFLGAAHRRAAAQSLCGLCKLSDIATREGWNMLFDDESHRHCLEEILECAWAVAASHSPSVLSRNQCNNILQTIMAATFKLIVWSSVNTLILRSLLLTLPAGLDRAPLSEVGTEGGEVVLLAEGGTVAGGPVDVVLLHQ
jgi:hypothetical protein